MLECRICGANCDPADLQGGVCDDCRETQEKKDRDADIMNVLMRSKYEQIELEVV